MLEIHKLKLPDKIFLREFLLDFSAFLANAVNVYKFLYLSVRYLRSPIRISFIFFCLL